MKRASLYPLLRGLMTTSFIKASCVWVLTGICKANIKIPYSAEWSVTLTKGHTKAILTYSFLVILHEGKPGKTLEAGTYCRLIPVHCLTVTLRNSLSSGAVENKSLPGFRSDETESGNGKALKFI